MMGMFSQVAAFAHNSPINKAPASPAFIGGATIGGATGNGRLGTNYPTLQGAALQSTWGSRNGRFSLGGGLPSDMRASVGTLITRTAHISDSDRPGESAQNQSADNWQQLKESGDYDRALLVDSKSLFSQQALFDERQPVPEHLNLFIEQCDDVMETVKGKVAEGEMSAEKAVDFQAFLVQVGNKVLNHPIIAKNAYLERFREGVTPAQARNELQQFSVFAFQFNVSLAKMIANADSPEEWATYTTILANEMGAPFAQGFDGELKGTFDLKHNHHTWLMKNAADLGLSFKEIGSRKVAHAGTKAFVDAVDRSFTNENRNVRGGAEFAIENWAAAKFWPLWMEGLKTMNKGLPPGEKVGMSYITYHDLEERHHSKETIDELLEAYNEPGFEPDIFLNSAVKMLDEGIQAYYESQLANVPDRDETWPTSIVAKK